MSITRFRLLNDAIAIMDEKAIDAIQRKPVPKLLDGPFRCGMFGEIPVHDPACADVEDDKDVQPLKGGRHHDEEVEREYGASVIAEERRPRWRDFSRQNKRKRSRCHRTSVSGRTIVRSSRQLTN